jgi:anthranilate synthase component 1
MNVELTADLETPVSAFLKLGPLQPLFLLESVERNEKIGRYSFIGILPKEYFVLPQSQNPAPFFRKLSDCLSNLPANEGMRLSSGLIGFFSYHACEFLHPRIQKKPIKEPVAAFVLPGAILIFDHFTHKIILSTILSNGEEKALANEVRACLSKSIATNMSGRSSPPRANLSEKEFSDLVDRAKQHISCGDIFQAVLSIEFHGESESHPFQMYRALRMINPSPYMFYFDFKNEFQFFGSSPETMVRVNGSKQALLRPIAGTRPRGKEEEQDKALERELLANDKERAEHLMLLDLARNDLGKIAEPGSVEVTEFMKIERFSHVMHLVSTVEGRLANPPSLEELFAAVFPAGTVSGAPKIRAMQIIHELEPHSRGLYAGSLGYMDREGNLDHCLAIRCIQRTGNQYRYVSGAGIVADSIPKQEYEEIAGKTMALRKMLEMAGESA